MEYLRHKYPAIRSEIEDLFEKINTKYPTKHNLTITHEFGVWKSDVKITRQSYQETPVVTTAAEETLAVTTTTTVMASTGQETPAVTTTTVMASAFQETPAVTTTTVMASAFQETPAVTTTTVMASSVQEPALCDLELGASTFVTNEDQWLDSLNDTEMQKIIEELRNDPDLQGIMDVLEQNT